VELGGETWTFCLDALRHRELVLTLRALYVAALDKRRASRAREGSPITDVEGEPALWATNQMFIPWHLPLL
jgi:hypothetical protein